MPLPYGYRFWIPNEDEISRNGWTTENSTFFHNHSQEVQAKIYNKKQDPEVEDEIVERLGKCGLVRVELALKRKFLIDNHYIWKEDKSNLINQLSYALWEITKDADVLLREYISEVLYSGEMLSKNLQKSYIKKMYQGKEARINKMLEYIELINSEDLEARRKYGSEKKVRSIEKHFEHIHLSPVYTQKNCPYIPSIKNICKGEVDGKLLRYVKFKTLKRHPEYIYWEY